MDMLGCVTTQKVLGTFMKYHPYFDVTVEYDDKRRYTDEDGF